ncbi:MAG: hypothetical protein ACI4SH_07200 [Candidatus Scatosoma sp.]
MKRKIAGLLSACIALSLFSTGCGASTEGYDYTGASEREFGFHTFLGIPSRLPVYNANETSYYLKDLTQEEFENYYKEMADAGFTVASAPKTPEGEEHNLRMLNAAGKYGLKQLLGEMISESGVSLTMMLQGRYQDPDGKNYADYTDAEIKSQLQAFLAPYLDHPAFYGLAVWDEPSREYYDNIVRAKRIFEEVAPGKLFYVNLLPITSTMDSLGIESNDQRLQYAEEYIEKIDLPYLSYDYYPLKEKNPGEIVIGEEFLYNMQVYRTAADSDNRELWTYLQATDHTFGPTVYPKLDNIAMFRWQVYSFLAFGGENITWFTYFPPDTVDSAGTYFGVGPYDRKGRKTEIYYFIQAVQREVLSFDEVYLNFEWKSIITVSGDKNADGFTPSYDYMDEGFAKNGHERITSYSCEQDTLIGCFADADGNDGFMITNYANPVLQKESRTVLSFKNAEAVAVYRRGQKRIVKLGKDGTYDTTLLPGEGMFVVPLTK